MPIAMSPSTTSPKPSVLLLGDDISYNRDTYARLLSQFEIIQPPPADLLRPAFMENLRRHEWGDFQAIMRPSWHSGGEMGKWDRELIELLPDGIQVYASAGAGYDWVDVNLLAEHGIIYCNGAGASSEAVGDMALYHIISVFRNLNWSTVAARSCDPAAFNDAHHNSPTTSHNPRGHTLGIVGLGNIGYVIAQKAYAAFGMHIIYHDIVRKSEEQEAQIRARYFEDIEAMLPETDCLLLATPSKFDGTPFLTGRILSLLPRGSRFVNIARGSLVDESALIEALESGHLAAAGLDVHANEPYVNEKLAEMRNVTMTPHTGGGVVETRVNFERLAMENVERVLQGKQALTGVNAHLRKAKHGIPEKEQPASLNEDATEQNHMNHDDDDQNVLTKTLTNGYGNGHVVTVNGTTCVQ